MSKLIQPYDHDCDECEWVGWFAPWADKPPFNIHLHGKTVVIRQSSEPGDYWSAKAGEVNRGPILDTTK